MDLGTLLVLLAIVLAVVSFFVRDHGYRLLTASVILGFVGVLLGVGGVLSN